MRSAAARFHVSSAGSRGASRTAEPDAAAGAGAAVVGAVLVAGLLTTGEVAGGVGAGAPHADSSPASAAEVRCNRQAV